MSRTLSLALIHIAITVVLLSVSSIVSAQTTCPEGSVYNMTDETCDYPIGGSVNPLGGGTNPLDDVSPDCPGTLVNGDCLLNSGTGGVSETPTGGQTEKPTGGVRPATGDGKLTNPLKSDSIESFLLKIIEVILVFALPIIILYIMYAGYLFVTARGETGQIETARTALLYAVVGGVIVLGAQLIIQVVQGTIKAF